MSKRLQVTDHPYMYPLRVLTWEVEALENQMIAAWRANRRESAHVTAQGLPGSSVLMAYTGRLRELGQQRRQLRAAMALLRVQEPQT